MLNPKTASRPQPASAPVPICTVILYLFPLLLAIPACLGEATPLKAYQDGGIKSSIRFIPGFSDQGVSSAALDDTMPPESAACSSAGIKEKCGVALNGVCAEGSRICQSDGAWSRCEPYLQPGALAEDCQNGQDDDCDGDTDEADPDCAPCTAGQERSCTVTGQVGECAIGSQSCSAGADWEACQGPTPRAEVCTNGLDDDCDGAIDAADPDCAVCTSGQQENCIAAGWLGSCAEGTRSCSSDGVWGACIPSPPVPEACTNNLDDDCDGLMDASDTDCYACSPGQQEGCLAAAAQGICHNGSRTCAAGGGWGDCIPGSPRAEHCSNGLDDDCDGFTDGDDPECYECTPGGQENCPLSALMGLCAQGRRTCANNGVWGACQQQNSARPEDCSTSEDEDCDGSSGYEDLDCLIDVYRHYNPSTGDHMVSVSSTEGGGVGYVSEGVRFRLLHTALPGQTHGLYRCQAAGDHFVSVDPGCEGFLHEGLIGYAFNSQRPGTSPLFRCVQGSIPDHLTHGAAEQCQQAGYTVEGIIGWVK